MPLETSATEWDFANVETDYLTHGFHCYPAKFIPQLPKRIISDYSKENEVVLDPFCGCGGALVEAKLLGRSSIGVDINPIACLVTKVKVTPLEESCLMELDSLLQNIKLDIGRAHGQTTIFGESGAQLKKPDFYNIDKWFQKHVQQELAIIKNNVLQIKNGDLRDFCFVAFSSIINRVSNMESETRYASIPKQISKGETSRAFEARLRNMIPRMLEFGKLCKNVKAEVYRGDARNMEFIRDGTVDLIVTSPPYIYAWDYSLIHRFRLFWLGYTREEIIGLQHNEIGSHLRLERKQKAAKDPNVAVEDYVSDMKLALKEFSRVCRKNARCCIIMGSSQLEGRKLEMEKITVDCARSMDFKLESHFVRTINAKRKSTNTSFARIKNEHVLLFRKL